MKKNIIRVLSFILCFCVLVTCVIEPKAHAISELVVIGIISMTLVAAGAITVLVSEANGTSEAFYNAAVSGLQDQAEFTEGLLSTYARQKGFGIKSLLAVLATSCAITRDGSLTIKEEGSNLLTDFFAWAWSPNGGNLVQYGTPENPMTVWTNDTGLYDAYGPVCGVGSFEWTYSVTGGSITRKIVINGDGYIVKSSSNSFAIIGPDNFSYEVFDNGEKNTLLSKSSATHITANPTDYYEGSLSIPSTASNRDEVPVTVTPIGTLGKNQKSILCYIMTNGTKDVIGGSADTPTYDEDALVLPAPGTGSNVLDIPGAIYLPNPISGTVAADDYLIAARDAITTGTGTLEYTDTAGMERTETLSGVGTPALTQVMADNPALEGETDIAEGVGSPTLDNYGMDLKEYFPFCIPYDLRDMINLITSAPAPIDVTWTFDFGRFGVYNIDIDLSDFDDAASTLRTMELLAFCVGLAFATKRLLMGG